MTLWPFAVLGLLAGAYFGLVILAMVTSGSNRGYETRIDVLPYSTVRL